jgi:hypothetical protein
MGKKSELAAILCLNFCAYYKPGKNEALACQGFAVVQRLIEGGRKLSLKKRGSSATKPATAQALRENVCRACSFRASDCDFILTEGKAAPCGGFVLLSLLLAEGEITLEDIK